MKFWTALAATVLTGAVFAAEVDLKSVKAYGAGTVEVTEDANGVPEIINRGIPAASATVKNRYLSFTVKLPQPMDLTGQTITFQVRSSKPELLTGFYVRGYNAASKGYALGWGASKMNVITRSNQIFQLSPGNSGGEMRWLHKVVAAEKPTSINRLQFLFCTATPDEEIDLVLRDLRISDHSDQELLKNFWQPLGDFSGFSKSVFQKNALIYCKKEAEMPVLTIQGHSPADTQKKSKYEAALFRFANPVALQGKTIQLQCKLSSNVTMLFVRLYNKDSKKADVSYNIRCPQLPKNEWQTLTLSKNKQISLDTRNMSGNPLSDVDRAEIIMATYHPDQDFQVQIKDLQILNE